MHSEAITKKDRATALTLSIQPLMPWRVTSVATLSGQRLEVSFIDGSSGIVDLSAMISSSEAGIFSQLRDPELFSQVYIEHGAVAWPGDLDLAPDAMHAALKNTGEWKLT